MKINGRMIEGLIDTGASLVAINSSTARRIGVVPAPAEFRHEVNTANGKVLGALVRLDTLDLGRIRIENVEAIVLDDKALRGTLIGMNVLKRLRKVEVQDNLLTLEQ